MNKPLEKRGLFLWGLFGFDAISAISDYSNGDIFKCNKYMDMI